MTMAKLASLAGVSVATVSKAFSGSREISAETRERIFKTAKEYGCYDKYSKRIFEKYVIAVICPEFVSNYYAYQLKFLEQEIRKRQGIMLVSSDNFSRAVSNEIMGYFTECVKVDGLITYMSPAQNMKYDTPIVLIGQSNKNIVGIVDSIFLSNRKAIYDAVKYFAENGHRDIAFIGDIYTNNKCVLFQQAMRDCGIEINNDYIIKSEERFEISGYHAMNRLLALKKTPTAVFTGYDNIAFGAMRSIYEHGLHIPSDISIIGMDDNTENPFRSVQLTSITAYNKDLCEIAVDILFDRIKNGSRGRVRKISISTELVKRDTVGKAKR